MAEWTPTDIITDQPSAQGGDTVESGFNKQEENNTDIYNKLNQVRKLDAQAADAVADEVKLDTTDGNRIKRYNGASFANDVRVFSSDRASAFSDAFALTVINGDVSDNVQITGSSSVTLDVTNVPTFERDIFTATGTFVVPSNVTRIGIQVFGGGGGGGGGMSDTGTGLDVSGGDGGNGGHYHNIQNISAGTTVHFTLGAGGTGGTGAIDANGVSGSSGGDSSYGLISAAQTTVAFGGGGGGGAVDNASAGGKGRTGASGSPLRFGFGGRGGTGTASGTLGNGGAIIFEYIKQ